MHTHLTRSEQLKHTLRKNLVSGLVVLVPLVVTGAVIKFLFDLVASILLPTLKAMFGAVPQWVLAPISVLVILSAILLVGSMSSHFVIRRLLIWGEFILDYVPFAKTVYTSSKKVIDMILLSDRAVLQEVGLIDYPYKGIKMVGFVSGQVVGVDGRRYYKMFMPTTPNPASGFLHLVPCEDVTLLDISVEDAVKFIVSAGVLSPETLIRRNDDSPRTDSGIAPATPTLPGEL
ncbi:MAG: DUF502 domain-containing protein [Candidatus Hydrogenedentes bacterium]|nr:DUF502 domain-containing protein [Candidatus Hydrogenedentota bacterium]